MDTARYFGLIAYFLLFSALWAAPASLISANKTPMAPASAKANPVSSPIPAAA